MFLLSAIFGYQYLYFGILLVVLLFLLSFYSIPIGIEKIRTRQLEKNYDLQMDMFAVIKDKDANWGELKKDLIHRLSKYNKLGTTRFKPRISITERVKASEDDDKELILLWLEVWIKKDENNVIKADLIEEFIEKCSYLLSLEDYQKHKFHVEQSNKTTNKNA